MRPDSTRCALCSCHFGSSECVEFTTRGPNDPYEANYILDDDPSQLAECGPSGFGVFGPPWLMDPPAVALYHSQPQSVPFDTVWPLLFNRERYDTDSMHDLEEDSSRITFNTAGIYLLTLNVTWKNLVTTSGDLGAAIRVDSSDYLVSDAMSINNTDGILAQSLTYEGRFTAGQYVDALVKQDALDDESEPATGAILAERYSPVFTATFLRLEP